MGKLTAFRDHLYNLFPHVFRRQLGANASFCLIIVDFMQYLAGHAKYLAEEGNDASGVPSSMRTIVERFLAQDGEYKATRGVVILLDTTKNVPTNKAHTQKGRHHDKGAAAPTSQILDEASYEKLLATDQGSYTGIGDLLRCPSINTTVWRSNNTKFQLYCAITEELLKIVPPRKNLQLIIDDGASVHPELYQQRREEMIAAYSFEEKSAYAQECLVSSLARHFFTERFIVSGNGEPPRRIPSPAIGEADVKIPRFIVKGNNTKRYLVVSQDTDIIFVLLLHLKTLLPFEEGFELWLDTQPPTDHKAGVSRIRRFIDVTALYHAILDLFGREYPQVANPIETLVFLTYAMETDFTRSFETCLHVTPRVTWNTFSALHTEPAIIKARGYLVFNDSVYDELEPKADAKKKEKGGAKRGVERIPASLHRWVGILNTAVSYAHDAVSDLYTINIDDTKCQSFLYLLCQQRVVRDLAGLGYSQFADKRTYIETIDELFVWTSEIEAKLDTYRLRKSEMGMEEESKKRKAQEALADKKPGAPVKKPKLETIALPVHRPAAATYDIAQLIKDIPEDIVMDVIEEEEQRPVKACVPRIQEKAKVVQKMESLLKEGVPKDYGVPQLQGMIARIYRVQWLMNYHQNGWKTSEYTTNFADLHPDDESLSLHGWKAKEIAQTEESIKRGDFNNSYYTSVYQLGIEPGKIPFKVYEMVESDQIYNRNHLAYINFGV